MANIKIEPCFGEDHKLLAIYVRLARGKVVRTRRISSGFLVDLDRNGRLLGVEMLQPGRLSIRLVRKVAKEYDAPVLSHIKPRELAAALG